MMEIMPGLMKNFGMTDFLASRPSKPLVSFFSFLVEIARLIKFFLRGLKFG